MTTQNITDVLEQLADAPDEAGPIEIPTITEAPEPGLQEITECIYLGHSNCSE